MDIINKLFLINVVLCSCLYIFDKLIIEDAFYGWEFRLKPLVFIHYIFTAISVPIWLIYTISIQQG